MPVDTLPHPSGLQQGFELIVGEVAIAKDLGEQAGVDDFADVDGNGRHSASA